MPVSSSWYFIIDADDQHIYLKRGEKILKGHVQKLKSQEDGNDGTPQVAVSSLYTSDFVPLFLYKRRCARVLQLKRQRYSA